MELINALNPGRYGMAEKCASQGALRDLSPEEIQKNRETNELREKEYRRTAIAGGIVEVALKLMLEHDYTPKAALEQASEFAAQAETFLKTYKLPEVN